MDEWTDEWMNEFLSPLLPLFNYYLSPSFSKGKTERSHIQLFWKHVVESYSGKGIINRIVDWRHSLWKTFWQCWLFRKGSLPCPSNSASEDFPWRRVHTRQAGGRMLARMLAAVCSGGRDTCVSLGEWLETHKEHPHAQPLLFAVGFQDQGLNPALSMLGKTSLTELYVHSSFISYFKTGSHLITFFRLGMNLLCKPEVPSILLPQLSGYPGWQVCVTGPALVINLGRKHPPHDPEYQRFKSQREGYRIAQGIWRRQAGAVDPGKEEPFRALWATKEAGHRKTRNSRERNA